MIRANFISSKGAWQAKAADSVVLNHEERQRRGVTLTAVRGIEFQLDLPAAVHIRGGDALVLEDGRLIEVVAAPEALAEIRTRDPRLMTRLAFHIGNRQALAEILDKGIRIHRDPELETLAKTLGAKVMHIEAPFEPDHGEVEPVADAHAGHVHGKHDHGKHDHSKHEHHGHEHDDGHEHGHAHKHDHDHGDGHNHGDDHKHGHADEHAAHNHAEHDHKGHDHKGHDHKGHDHSGHKH